jgi:uncharacterized membrane protein
MSSSPKNSCSRGRLIWLPLGPAAALAVLAWRVPPDGREHAHLAQFFGRFHPLIVHAPIALLLILPLMELAGRRRGWEHLQAAAGFVLWCAAAGAVASGFDGWLLAWSGGYKSGLVTWHMWSGVALAGLASAAAIARGGTSVSWEYGSGRDLEVGTGGLPVRSNLGASPSSRTGAPPVPTRGSHGQTKTNYVLLLVASVALMIWTGEQGGEISHGGDYLTEFMPARLQSLLGVKAEQPKPEAPAPVAKTVYAARIMPLLRRSCISCHNAKKSKGGLRLDTYELMMRGSEDGVVIVPWDPEDSELIRRVSLPSSDDDFMPADGRKPLSPEEVKLFERWIAAGASQVQPLNTLR